MITTERGRATVDRFIDAIQSGAGVPADLYAAEASLDATVPGWRFVVRGSRAIADEFSKWFGHPGVLEEIERLTVDDGEVISYLVTWMEKGVRHAAHHCHRMRLNEDGRILFDRVFCGGRWNAALLAEMAAAGDDG